jgi:hypothetical protein
MSFLSNFMMQHNHTLSNLDASDDESEIFGEKNTESSNFNENDSEIEDEGTTSLIGKPESEIISEPLFKKPKKKFNTSNAERVAGPMIDFLRSKTNKSAAEDPDLLYFKSL